MRRLIQVLSGIWLLITILLIVVLVAGQVLSGSAEMIVFQSQRESHTDIYLLDVPTGITRNLTRQPGRMQPLRPGSDDDTADYPAQPQRFIGQWSDVSPALSPDGRQLACSELNQLSLLIGFPLTPSIDKRFYGRLSKR